MEAGGKAETGTEDKGVETGANDTERWAKRVKTTEDTLELHERRPTAVEGEVEESCRQRRRRNGWSSGDYRAGARSGRR